MVQISFCNSKKLIFLIFLTLSSPKNPPKSTPQLGMSDLSNESKKTLNITGEIVDNSFRWTVRPVVQT